VKKWLWHCMVTYVEVMVGSLMWGLAILGLCGAAAGVLFVLGALLEMFS